MYIDENKDSLFIYLQVELRMNQFLLLVKICRSNIYGSEVLEEVLLEVLKDLSGRNAYREKPRMLG